MKIEIHVIQSLPTSNMNSDREGKPKSIIYGGFKRLRLSQQAQKRAARTYTHHHNLLNESDFTHQSRKLAELVTIRLVDRLVARDQAQQLVQNAFFLAGFELNEDQQSSYMIVHTPAEIADLTRVILEHQEILNIPLNELQASQNAQTKNAKQKSKEEELQANQNGQMKESKQKGKKTIQAKQPQELTIWTQLQRELKRIFAQARNLELALYGRKLMTLPEGTVDGQVQVMHGFSVHAILDESDFFTALDDYAVKEQPQAGMLGDRGIAAPTLYRMAAVNVSQLEVEVQSKEAALKATRAFVESFVMSLPKAGRSAFSADTPPVFVMLLNTGTHPVMNLAPAFERPVVTSPNFSMSSRAAQLLEGHLLKVEKAYPKLQGRRRVAINLTDYLPTSIEVLENLESAMDRILE
jgi:CRISPR system Cascade subunit CasC